MAELLIPEYVDGKPTFVPYAHDIQRKLREGAPEFGWQGDPRLYITPRDGAEGWAVGRIAENGTKHLVCFSKAPHRLDENLLIMLRDNDTRRHDVLQRINNKNDALQREHDQAFQEKTAEMIDRVAWGLHKDLGHHA